MAAPIIFSEISFSCIIYKSSAVLSVLCASALKFTNLLNQLLAVLENIKLPTRDVRTVRCSYLGGREVPWSHQFMAFSRPHIDSWKVRGC